MNLSKKLAKRAAATRANPPSTIQLPGGVILKAFDFRITAVDSHGQPTAFERAEPGSDSDAILWADPDFMDKRLRSDLDARFKARIEASIEGPDLVTEEREYKGRSVGISNARQLGKTEGATEALKEHWPDCATNHGSADCDMGPECGEPDQETPKFLGPAHAPGHE